MNLIPEKGSEDALFLSLKNNRISVDAIEKMIVKYARMYVPHKRITPHKLRSTFGTQLYQETGDLYLVAETLSHSSVDTSKKYASMKERKRLVAQTIPVSYTHLGMFLLCMAGNGETNLAESSIIDE